MDEEPVDYLPRIADAELAAALRASGAVLIEGARGCGKTETALRRSASRVLLDVDDAAREAGLLDASLLLQGDRPRLIDEWQLVPQVWNQVRRAVDVSGGRPGSFILTGSTEAREDHTRHSGALRILRLMMRPMTLAEMGHSSGDISLDALLRGGPIRAGDPGLDIRDIAELVSVGGWPALRGRTVNEALTILGGYLRETARVDLRRLDGPRHDVENVLRTLRSLARHVATPIQSQTIAKDIRAGDDPIDRETVKSYLDALTRIYVLEDLPAWAPTLRANARARTSPKRHLVDPSLAVAALGADPDRLVFEVDTLGLLFESLVIRDLRVYAQAMGAHVMHYLEPRIEADAIVECPDGRWAAFEMKLGPSEVEEGAASLRALAARMVGSRQGSAQSLNVITGWGYGYTRPDGINVVPLGALAP